MDKESKLSSADQKHQRRQRREPVEPHTTSSTHLVLPDPYVSDHSLRGNQSDVSFKQSPSKTNGMPAGRGGDVSRVHGYSSSRRVRENSDDFLQRERTVRNPQAKTSKTNNYTPSQSKGMGKNQRNAHRKDVRGARSDSNSGEKSIPSQSPSIPFEVKMTDFPELAGVMPSKADPAHFQSGCWGPISQRSASSWKAGKTESPTQSDCQEIAKNVQPDSAATLLDQPVVTSWANVASQPPKKPVPKEKTTSSNSMQMEESAVEPEDEASGKKKRKKKKKKAKGAGENAEAESEVTAVYQEPPKFEDEEEFPDLNVAFTGTTRLVTSSYAAKLCNEENQKDVHQSAEQIKGKSPATKSAPTETTKKKAEKVSGKKSKVPVQLDIGNMLSVLEKKQQSQKAKQDAKPVILSVGGGLPVVQKQPPVQKKAPWQQDKIAHNPLDSTSPLVKKGKQREVPKAKKPTPLKKIILKEREERKQRRLLEEMGLLPENEFIADKPAEDQCDTSATGEVGSPTEEPDEDKSELNGSDHLDKEDGQELDKEEQKEDTAEQQTTLPVTLPANRPKIHSRKFRDYCSQMLSKDVDKCVTDLLKELVRFQDRLYQKDPMKARMKRRIVMGLREVLKHLKLRKVKCVIISPNCERIQSKGGLDEALYTIIDTCREQGVPFVFALSRKALGHCVNKAVPVSLDFYHKMIELSSEARQAYEVMVSSLEQSEQAEEEQTANTKEELEVSSLTEAVPSAEPTQLEEPEYIKIWKKMLEKDYNHKFLNFEEQMNSMHLDSECTDILDEEEKS
ncbi:selenocysteine insertion sequence-binding protein 2-like isoform X2 [Cheilinus undulatus]|uniref:selenocysteine insertion sequence-binding protein 2-like isoform X2 n=1 Tax=Cheilinus undulatus TaxID=241271 RepID=UPI001BD20031|nr:selenocysteine insertion sequence-binding protein 2-like isoform X2 [Cheilinus undulatus]